MPLDAEFYYAIAALFGLVVGSFANALIYRLPSEKSLWTRSQCTSCSKTISWYDNIPVLSFLILRSRCRQCSSRISVRYPLVELIVSALFVAVVHKEGWHWLIWIRDWPLMLIFVAVIFIDLDHRIIPDELSIGGAALGLATAYWDSSLGLKGALIGSIGGFVMFYGFAWAYLTATKKSGLGGGDIKFLATIGAFVGFQGVIVTIFLSSIIGSLVGIGYAVATRQKVLGLALPYGPFLVGGALVYYFCGHLIQIF